MKMSFKAEKASPFHAHSRKSKSEQLHQYMWVEIRLEAIKTSTATIAK